MDDHNIVSKLKEYLDDKRYKHSIAVSETAVKLAAHYNVDVNKAYIAGLLHDCAKMLSYDKLYKICVDNNIVFDEVCINQWKLMHGPVGAIIAQEEFDIVDSDILNAIRYHTIGRRGMNKLEKIIYLADLIEPNRSYTGAEELRSLANDNLDKAMLKAFNNTILFVLASNNLLHPETVEARNCILNEMKEYST